MHLTALRSLDFISSASITIPNYPAPMNSNTFNYSFFRKFIAETI